MPKVALLKQETATLDEANIRNDSWLSRGCLLWVYAIIAQGRKGKIVQDELKMPGDQACERASARFEAAWADELKLKGSATRPSLLRALKKAFGFDVFIAGVWKLSWSVLVLLGAFYFVRSLVQYVSDPKKNYNQYNADPISNNGVGWILACTFFLDSILVGVALQRMGDACVRGGIKIRAALMTAVYRKTFRLNSVHNEGAGNVVSLVSTDCSKLYEGVLHVHNVWTAPLEAIAIIALLLSLTEGTYGLPALGIVFFVLPLQYYLGYRIAKYKLETVEVSDSRVLRMQEILLAIKLVKFYCWEKSFSKQVNEVRAEEIKLLSKTAVVKTMNLCLVFAVPPVIALVIFATYVYNVGRFDSVFSFTVLSLFNTLRFPLVVLPKALRGTSEAIASIQRIEKFLMLEEGSDHPRSSNTEVRFKDAVLSHSSNKEDFRLKIPKFEVRPGEVAAIVGRVGSGKSSVFQAILQNMVLEKGVMAVGGSISYVPQTPWVQNLTLRDNILFGLPYDEVKYKKVIHACALELDLQILPQGDQSMAGERGINLSGGQRQRVGLARATYHDSDLILLDNPLSAVDQHTAIHIFEHCIRGMLRDKAVVWITHQLELLPQCDTISVMEGGQITYFGPYSGDVLNQRLPVDHLLFATVEAGDAAVKAVSGASTPAPSNHGTTAGHEGKDNNGHGHDGHGPKRLLRRSFQRGQEGMRPVDSVAGALSHMDKQDEESSVHDQAKQQSPEKTAAAPNQLPPGAQLEAIDMRVHQSAELVATMFNGFVKRLSAGGAFMVYWRAGGIIFGVLAFFIFMATQTCRIYSDLWIRWWADDIRFTLYSEEPEGTASNLYLLCYLALVLHFILLLLSRDAMFSIWHVVGSTRLHNNLFARVLSAPILFFLRTPVGDVLNSFAKDQDTLDETLPDTIHMSTIYFMILCTSLAIVTVSIYYYAALTAALFGAFLVMQFLYLPAATVLKRWAGETASQVYVHVDESLHGMEVIKAFNAVNYFIQENIQRINIHHLALFNTEQCHLWLAFWCDFFGAILVVATCLFSVGLKDELGSAAVGLAISNTIQVLVFFTWVVRGVADSVSMWDAVERVTSFATNIPMESQIASNLVEVEKAMAQEHRNEKDKAVMIKANGTGVNHVKGGEVTVMVDEAFGRLEVAEMNKVLESWPSTGDIKFEQVCLRYYPGAPLALKFISFHINDKEKIGVVGRTGSGKTTLLLALFRMFELAYGHIIIDGVNIAALPLSEVRSRLAIIPQEPVMFKGTVRSNLDPFNDATDAELWHSLDMVHMKEAVADMPNGLDANVAEGGSNFSLGQKQLICMARCVIKKTHVLVLDEATAAMDLQTDSLIQKTIRRVFKGRTTITIAHRLDTIIFSDRILAMAAGELKEFDTPDNLLRLPTSMFNKLVNDTGPHASASLRKMAADGPQNE
ncbi:ABC transporter [Haematococcus lacustris]